HKVLPRMPFDRVQRVVPVIAEVKKNHFVALAQRSPERKVAVNRETVAVAEHEARRAGDAVLANVDGRAVGHLHVEGVPRAGHMMRRMMLVRFVHSLTASLPDRYRLPEKYHRALPTVRLRPA